jgi:hypothetical protein
VRTFVRRYREIALSRCNSCDDMACWLSVEWNSSIPVQIVWGHYLVCTVKLLYLSASPVRTFARLYGEIALSRCNSCEDMSCCSSVQWSSSIFVQLVSGYSFVCTVKYLNLGGKLLRTFVRLYREIALSRYKSCEDISSSIRWNKYISEQILWGHGVLLAFRVKKSIPVHLLWGYCVLHVCTVK